MSHFEIRTAVCHFLLAVGLGACAHAPASRGPELVDRAPHQVRMIEVAPGVKLEALDFSGAGTPLVFLAGMHNTAHVFDALAPSFLSHHRVVAITRRGFGASSWPDSGYDLATRVRDDLAVLNALHVERAIWVGHSVAGDELTALAGAHPERVAGLVYLDAVQDHSRVQALLASMPSVPQREPPADAFSSPSHVATFMTGVMGMRPPDGEILATFEFAPDGRMTRPRERADAEALYQGHFVPQDFATVHAPALVMVSVPEGPQDVVPGYSTFDASTRAAFDAWWPKADVFYKAERDDVRAHLAGARILEWPHAHHYLFITRQADVEREMHQFLGD